MSGTPTCICPTRGIRSGGDLILENNQKFGKLLLPDQSLHQNIYRFVLRHKFCVFTWCVACIMHGQNYKLMVTIPICPIEVGWDLQDKSQLFYCSQVNSIVIPIYKNREKRIFEFGVRLNLPHLTWNFALFTEEHLKMATGRKWRSWLKWSRLDFYQMSWHHTPPDSVQSHSDNPRHLPDTSQTPYRHPHILTNPRHLAEKEKTNEDESIGCLLIACTSYPPQALSRVTQTTLRHLPDTLQTPRNMAHFDQSRATRRKWTS